MNDRPLGSIEQFPYKQGVKAAEILFSLLENPALTELPQPIFQQVVFESK